MAWGRGMSFKKMCAPPMVHRNKFLFQFPVRQTEQVIQAVEWSVFVTSGFKMSSQIKVKHAFSLVLSNRKETARMDLCHLMLLSDLLQFLQSPLVLAAGAHALGSRWDL